MAQNVSQNSQLLSDQFCSFIIDDLLDSKYHSKYCVNESLCQILKLSNTCQTVKRFRQLRNLLAGFVSEAC